MSVAKLQEEAYRPAPRAGTAHADDESRDLLGRVLDELLNSLLLTSTTTSIANAAAAKRAGCSRRMIAGYLPPAPSLFPSARLRMGSKPAVSAPLARMGAYYAHLQLLTELTLRIAGGNPELAGDAAISTIVDAWQGLAHVGLDALDACLVMIEPEILEQARGRIRTASVLLEQVEAGATPCVDAYGAITLPAGADRRRSVRGSLNLQAFFQIEESLQRAAVINASEQGLGVLGLKGVAEGARIHLLLKPGMSISGSVIWANGERYGIRLDAPLPPDCDLLRPPH